MFVNKVGQNKKWDGLQTLTMEKEMWFIITGFTVKHWLYVALKRSELHVYPVVRWGY
jgi:hypothetical protein